MLGGKSASVHSCPLVSSVDGSSSNQLFWFCGKFNAVTGMPIILMEQVLQQAYKYFGAATLDFVAGVHCPSKPVNRTTNQFAVLNVQIF